MISDATRCDLEQLLGEIDAGWTNCSDIKQGIGGCLLSEMYRVVGMRQAKAEGTYRFALTARVTDMIRALGFEYSKGICWDCPDG